MNTCHAEEQLLMVKAALDADLRKMRSAHHEQEQALLASYQPMLDYYVALLNGLSQSVEVAA